MNVEKRLKRYGNEPRCYAFKESGEGKFIHLRAWLWACQPLVMAWWKAAKKLSWPFTCLLFLEGADLEIKLKSGSLTWRNKLVFFWLLLVKGWLCLPQTRMWLRFAVPELPKGLEWQEPTGVMSLTLDEVEIAQNQAGNVESCKEKHNFALKMTTEVAK